MQPATTKKKRNKIRFCYRDYLSTLSAEEQKDYQEKIGPLAEIILSSENDEEVIIRARQFDKENSTAIFPEAVRLTIYCVACHKFDCTC